MKKIETKDLVMVALFAALAAVGAFLRIPLPYLPITLQVYFVFLAGVVLGPKLGSLSQIVYLAIGLLGIPIFAEGGGLGYIFNPSFGFLLGFIPAAGVMGILTYKKEPKMGTIFIASVVALFVLYLVGVPYMYFALNYFVGKKISFLTAIKIGVAYIPGDFVKIILLVLTGPPILKGFKERI